MRWRRRLLDLPLMMRMLAALWLVVAVIVLGASIYAKITHVRVIHLPALSIPIEG
jgi:hypothetical protein